MKQISCVIFDLFGTLVDNMPVSEHRKVLTTVANVLSLPPERFIEEWNGSYRKRATGEFPTTEAAIRHICGSLDGKPGEEAILEACRIRTDYTRRILVPRSDAVPTLTKLRADGYAIGLISDCTCEVPPVWAEIAFAPLFDVAIFSCEVRVKKPDPRIYHTACSRLGVDPGQVLYVGDGSSNELTGACEVGMTPVWIDVPYEREYATYKIDEQTWDGLSINALEEIPGLVIELNENRSHA